MFPPSLRHKAGPALPLALIIFALPAAATGQEPPPEQPTSQPEQVVEPVIDLSADAVQASIKQVEAATDLLENVKTELLTL